MQVRFIIFLCTEDIILWTIQPGSTMFEGKHVGGEGKLVAGSDWLWNIPKSTGGQLFLQYTI